MSLKVKPDGSVLRKRWDMNITLQSNSSHDVGSAFVSPSHDEADGFLCPENLPPSTVVALQSREIMELTITKSFIGVLSNLAESFAALTAAKKKELPVAPFIIRNNTGKPVTLLLDNRGFKYFLKGEKAGERSQVELPPGGGEVYLFLSSDRSEQRHVEYISPLQQQKEQAEAGLRLRVGGETGVFELPVSKADSRFFPFPFRGDEMGDLHGMVSQVSVRNGCKHITLRSIVQIKNHFDRTVNVFAYDGDGKDYRYVKLASLKPDESFDVPIQNVYAAPYEFCFQVDGDGQKVGLESYCWRKLIEEEESYSVKVQCKNRHGGPDIFLNVEGVREQIFSERSGKLSAVSYVLDIRPLLVFKNCLPVTLHYGFGSSSVGDLLYMEPGRSAHLQGVRLGETRLVLKIFEFRNTDWECEQVLHESMPELVTWRFSSAGDSPDSGLKLDLEVNSTTSHGTQVLSVYAPFWMVNKTGKMLTYRGQDPQNIIYHPVELEGVPMMFSYVARAFLGKRKASLRIEDSAWSDPFTLDTIEDAGKVSCRRPGMNGTSSKSKCNYSVGVNIAMSRSSLTKIITFTPYYIFLNTAEFSVSLRELDGDSDFVVVPPGESVPFWPLAGAVR